MSLNSISIRILLPAQVCLRGLVHGEERKNAFELIHQDSPSSIVKEVYALKDALQISLMPAAYAWLVICLGVPTSPSRTSSRRSSRASGKTSRRTSSGPSSCSSVRHVRAIRAAQHLVQQQHRARGPPHRPDVARGAAREPHGSRVIEILPHPRRPEVHPGAVHDGRPWRGGCGADAAARSVYDFRQQAEGREGGRRA